VIRLRILLADDEQSIRRVLQVKLEKAGHNVVTVGDGREAAQKLQEDRWDLLISDIRMPDVDGIELLEQARGIQPDLKVILMTAYATVAQAVEAVKLGAFDYITKPFEDSELFAAIDKVARFQNLEQENKRLKTRLDGNRNVPRLIGVSSAFKEVISLADRIAPSDATVLITGDSGTGKELVARRIHAMSNRSGGEFVAVNCGAIPADLIESELFGHVRGAFTGAVRDKKGKFTLADEGTIFLDEVGELAIELQAKLLRVLQERVVEPVGSEVTRRVDVRVIGATNTNLQRMVAEGTFREDLFYRLNVIPIRIPTLAERKEDIPLLVREFVARYAPHEDVTVSEEVLTRLSEHHWPGNVRELENLVERLVVLRRSDTLTPRDLPADFGSSRRDFSVEGGKHRQGGHVTFHEAEESLVRDALQKTGWNRTRAAEYLDIPRHVLIYRMKKYGIDESSTP
jgi:two-component system NtrC family response regulator